MPSVDIYAHYVSEAYLQVVEKQGERFRGTNVNGLELEDPAFTPVFERIHALALPVYCFDMGYERPVEVVTRLAGCRARTRNAFSAGRRRDC